MINFIVCDDNKIINKAIVGVINKVMMKNITAYKIHDFFDYDSSFVDIINEKLSNKIYILDIETPSRSGIDIARMIRQKDLDSVIIFLTSHEELGYMILKSEFMFLTFICKFDDYKNKLASAIERSLVITGHKKMIKFNDHGACYTIPLEDILYITRDSIERKCILKTDYTEFHVSLSLADLFKMVGENFKYSHRACIVNTARIRKINHRKREIVFDNGEMIDLLSDSYKRELVVK